MKPTDLMIQVACERLGVDKATACANWSEIPELPDACLFSAGARGGGRVIVDAQGEALWAASGVHPRAHIEAFRAGRRS